jgi:hypothetical protein
MMLYNDSIQYSAQLGVPSKGFGKRQASYQDPNHQPPVRQPTEGQVCRDLNEGNEGHRDRFWCPEGRIHLCSICGHAAHPQYVHDAPKGKDKVVTKARAITNSRRKEEEKARKPKAKIKVNPNSEASQFSLNHRPSVLLEPPNHNSTQP